jgi:flagellar biogenesis protein FliO
VHLLEVENRRILIGSTSERITKLTEFPNTFEQTLKQQQDRQNTDENK